MRDERDEEVTLYQQEEVDSSFVFKTEEAERRETERNHGWIQRDSNLFVPDSDASVYR